MNHTLIKIFICIHIFCIKTYADTLNNSCDSVINISNSPNVIDSPCSVPFKKIMIELSYTNQQLMGHTGTQQNFPNAELRIGLPSNNEFFIGLPNYISQTHTPTSGSTAVFSGMKQSINFNEKWLFALEEIVSIPGGSYAYGTQNWGAGFDGIASYNINDQLSLTAMLRITRISESPFSGGESFNSINPYAVLSYSPNNTISFYGEIYGQSKISAFENAGFNFDSGCLLLINQNTVVYFSAGQQLYNYLGGFKHYINAGVSIML